MDIERKFRPTICADVRHLPLRDDVIFDVALASPPCNCFSIAGVWRHWKPGKIPNPETVIAINLIQDTLDWMKCHARKYLLENPMGMARDRIVLGKPYMTLNLSDYGTKWKKRTDFWGNIILPLIEARRGWEKTPKGSNLGVAAVRDPAKRALLPFKLSETILEAVSAEGDQ